MTKKVKKKRARSLESKAGPEPHTNGDVTASGSPSTGVEGNRRKLLKRTARATATAALATWLLPKQWQKPAIDVVGLPVHAQTSPAVATTAGTTLPTLPAITISADRTSVVAGGRVTLTLRSTQVHNDGLIVNMRYEGTATYGLTEDGGDYTVEGASLKPTLEIKRGRSENNSIRLFTYDDADTGTETVVIGIVDLSTAIRNPYTVGTPSEVTVTILPRSTTTAAPTTAAPPTTAVPPTTAAP